MEELSRNRRWCIPTAILRNAGETLECVAILYEFESTFGLLLFQLARDVSLWAGTSERVRDRLFSPNRSAEWGATTTQSEIPSAVVEPITTLCRAVYALQTVEADTVSICCLEVAAWALREGAPNTATAFAQAGSLASPEFAEAALFTGQCAIAAGQCARGEMWLRRSIALARRERDWTAYSAGCVLLGTVYEERQLYKRAEQYFVTGFRASRRHSALNVRQDAAYGLFRLAQQRGDPHAATRFAMAAQKAYRKDHPGKTSLLLDLARFWIDNDQLVSAQNVLRRLAPRVGEMPRAEAIGAVALLARATARDRRKASERAENQAWELLNDESTTEETYFKVAIELMHAGATRKDRAAFDRAARVALSRAPRQRYEWTRKLVAELQEHAFPALQAKKGA